MKKLKDFTYLSLRNYEVKSLTIKSQALKGNPLGDPSMRHNPVLVPVDGECQGIVFVLAGLTGNGPNYFGLKAFDLNFPQQVDAYTSKGLAPKAAYIFVDAWTAVGGSQFLNSTATGKYEDYMVKELLKEAKAVFGKDLPVAVCGASSGGYGAIYLSTKYPKDFPYMMAIAPDSMFEINFLKDMYISANYLQHFEQKSFLKKLTNGELNHLKNFHPIVAAVSMSACYCPRGEKILFPIDCHTGAINESLWKKCLEKDPIHFLPKRITNTKKLKGIYLDVGNRDEFYLHMGARQMKNLWKKNKIPHHYTEYDGGHFDTHSRRQAMFTWLLEEWDGAED